MVRYYGYYSHKSRRLRKKTGKDDELPALIQPAISPEEFRKNWARLIQKIYHVNPLLRTNCLGFKKIISFIDQDELIERILRHLGLPARSYLPREGGWETRNHNPPANSATHIPELTYDDSYSQVHSEPEAL